MMTARNALAHENMVAHQIRGWDVVDTRVLATLAALPREEFVPAAWRSLAFADLAVPLGHGETMMPPVVEGRMLQALGLEPDDHVLEIGTGSGFVTACLARLAASVLSVELRKEFTDTAAATLRRLGVENATLVAGEAVRDWHPGRHFDAVVVTGAVATIPARWHDWMAPEGRMFVIHGDGPAMCASLLRNHAGDVASRESLFDTRLPWLRHAEPAADYSI